MIVAPLLKCRHCAKSSAQNNICNVETAGRFGRRVRQFARDCWYRGKVRACCLGTDSETVGTGERACCLGTDSESVGTGERAC